MKKSGEKVKINLHKYDSGLDIAVLKSQEFSFTEPSIYITKNPVNLGDEIFALGYPFISSMGNDIKITNGIISSKSGYMGDTKYLQVSSSINPGNSGGPLVDKTGNLVGVVTSKHTQAENSGYVLKMSYLKAFLEENSIDFQISNIKLPEAQKPFSTIADRIASSVFIVFAE